VAVKKVKIPKVAKKEPKCKLCNDSKVTVLNGINVECFCVKKAKIKEYVTRYGSMSMPADWIREKIDKAHAEFGLVNNIVFMFDSTVTLREQNGAMGYALSLIYPKPYVKMNVFELVYVAFEDEAHQGFSNLHQINVPHLALTYGQGEFKNKRQEELINQLLMKRLSDGTTTWFHSSSLNIDLPEVKKYLSKCEFHEIKFDKAISILRHGLFGLRKDSTDESEC